MLNLLSNAAKYTSQGGQVHVRRIASDETSEVGIEISDNGRGMDKGQLMRLFTMFDRLGAEHGGVEGSGVGLCVVRDLVHELGGRLGVASQLGRGTQVRVWLPRA